jgi:hypothetical protein
LFYSASHGIAIFNRSGPDGLVFHAYSIGSEFLSSEHCCAMGTKADRDCIVDHCLLVGNVRLV